MIKINHLSKTKLPYLFLGFLTSIFIYQAIFITITRLFNDDPTMFEGHKKVILNSHLITLFVVPIIETIIFQYMIIWFFYQVTEKYWVAILISSILFGLNHYFSIYYIIGTIGSGFIFAFFFSIIHNKYNNWYLPIIITSVLHGSWNYIVFLIKTFL